MVWLWAPGQGWCWGLLLPWPVKMLLWGWCWGGLAEPEEEGGHVGAEVSESVLFPSPRSRCGEWGQGSGLGRVSSGHVRSLSLRGAELGQPWCCHHGLTSSDRLNWGVPQAVACICNFFLKIRCLTDI